MVDVIKGSKVIATGLSARHAANYAANAGGRVANPAASKATELHVFIRRGTEHVAMIRLQPRAADGYRADLPWMLLLDDGRIRRFPSQSEAKDEARRRWSPVTFKRVWTNPARKTMPAPIKPVKAKRNPRSDTPGDFSQSSYKVLGRPWNGADSASLKTVGDDAVVRLTWKDGEWLQMVLDDRAAALKQLRHLGFDVK